MKFNDLSAQWDEIEDAVMPKMMGVLRSGNYILSEAVNEFEDAFAEWNGNKYAIGVGNGTDAVTIAFDALNINGTTKVYIPANTFVATLLGVLQGNNCAVGEYELIDCDSDFQMDLNKLNVALLRDVGKYANTIVIAVHLYGFCCNMARLMCLKDEFKFKLIEDCAQAHGTYTEEFKNVGTFGELSTFSMYPGKNLGACGDAGIIVTDDCDLWRRCKAIRNFGSSMKYSHELFGYNSRLDSLQAVILTEKLKYLRGWNNQRRKVAYSYGQGINNRFVIVPKVPVGCNQPTYHVFPIITERRQALIDHLNACKVPTLMHYPNLIEDMPIFNCNLVIPNKTAQKYAREELSLPIHPYLSKDEINHVIQSVNSFAG